MKKNNFILFTLFAFITLSACKKGGGGGAIEPEPTKTPVGVHYGNAVTQTIGSAGGNILSDDGEFELIIPSGALATNTDITIQPITNTTPSGRGKAYRCTPDGQQFAKDITLKFYYAEEDLALTKPEYMQVAFQNANGSWQVMQNVTNDVTSKTITAKVNHFTDFSQFDVLRILPAEAFIKTGESQNFEISYVGMTSSNFITFGQGVLNSPIVWRANGITNGNTTHGTINGTTHIGATYTAPANTPAINPVVISAEVNVPFTVDGQRFNQGILTASVYIVGGKYSVLIESDLDITMGTFEKFRIRDQVSFTVNLAGITGSFITNIQNSNATIQKIEDSPFDCVTTIESSGTGGIHLHDEDLDVTINPLDQHVYVSILQTGVGVVHPKAVTACGTNTPGHVELLAGNPTGGGVTFIDNGLQQSYDDTGPHYSIKYKIVPLP